MYTLTYRSLSGHIVHADQAVTFNDRLGGPSIAVSVHITQTIDSDDGSRAFDDKTVSSCHGDVNSTEVLGGERGSVV
ncbi:hypothetical protein BC628DRAFT_1401196 [Trametes gibbosa]|nr:hypothetical protein BC628DRAFT_1401196 [Trametes gibbosa]